MRLTEKQIENRRKEDAMRQAYKEACKSAWDDKQFCETYYSVKEKMSGMKELGIDCQIVVPGVTQKALIKALDIYEETDTDKIFEMTMYEHTQMLFAIEYYYQKGWFLAKVACRDRSTSTTSGRTVWYLEMK